MGQNGTFWDTRARPAARLRPTFLPGVPNHAISCHFQRPVIGRFFLTRHSATLARSPAPTANDLSVHQNTLRSIGPDAALPWAGRAAATAPATRAVAELSPPSHRC